MPLQNSEDGKADSVSGGLTFTANVECPECDCLFEGVWHDDSMDVEQLAEPPVATQKCPECGKEFEEQYPGWTNFSDAG